MRRGKNVCASTYTPCERETIALGYIIYEYLGIFIPFIKSARGEQTEQYMRIIEFEQNVAWSESRTLSCTTLGLKIYETRGLLWTWSL